MNKNDICYFNITLVEDMVATSGYRLEATRVRNGEVATDGCSPVVIVANAVVVAATAVKVALHGVPLSSDVAINPVPDVEKKPLRHFSHQQMQDKLITHVFILLPNAIVY